MSRRVWGWILIASIMQSLIAIGSFGLLVVADRSEIPAMRWAEREIVFADVPKYFEHANRTFAGQIPYREDPIEYPLLTLPFVYAPRLVATTQARFVAVFVVEMLAFNAVLVALVAIRVAKTSGEHEVPRRLVWMTAYFAGVCPFVIGRYDIVPAVLGFAAACAWFNQRRVLGGFFAAIGTLVKVVPGAVAMIGFVDELPRLGMKPTFRGTLAFGATLTLGIAAWVAIGGRGVVDSLRYHSGRGIEIGSIPSGLLWIRGWMTDAAMQVVHDHESLNLIAPGSSGWSNMAIWVQAGFMAAVALSFLLNGRRDPVRYSAAAILAFVIGGKVLSPQYLIWILPFAASLNGQAGRWSRPLFLIATLITGLLYPWTTGALRSLEPWAFWLLNIRNGSLLAIWGIWMFMRSNEVGNAKAISEVQSVL